VTSKAVADRIKIEQGKFYCYYTPSFLNSPDPTYTKTEVAHQLLLQSFRDEFTPKNVDWENFLNQKSIESGRQGYITADLIDAVFDECFDRTYHIEFSAKPDFAAFKRMLKEGISDEEDVTPKLFIYSREKLDHHWPTIKEKLMLDEGVFDPYFSNNKDEVCEVFPVEKPNSYLHPDSLLVIILDFQEKLKRVKRDKISGNNENLEDHYWFRKFTCP
jgi:hypothetical protein